MKILHTADIHLGARFRGLGQKKGYLGNQLLNTFTRIIDLSIKEDIDLLIISGDLFDSSNPPHQLVDSIADRIKRSGKEMCLVPGTHDNGLYNRNTDFGKIPNLTIFNESEWKYREYPNLNLTVYGINQEEKYPLKKIIPKTGTKYHVAILHAGYYIPGKTNDDILITPEEIALSKMDYIALGHWHGVSDYSQGNTMAWYPGSPFPIAISDIGAGNVIIIDEMKPRITQIGSIKCKEIDVDITGIADMQTLKEKIAGFQDKNLRCKINLKGLSSLLLGVDTQGMKEELSSEFAQLEIINSAIVPKEKLDPSAYEERPVIKRFLELMQNEINSREGKERETAEQAMQYGLALLEGAEVL